MDLHAPAATHFHPTRDPWDAWWVEFSRERRWRWTAEADAAFRWRLAQGRAEFGPSFGQRLELPAIAPSP